MTDKNPSFSVNAMLNKDARRALLEALTNQAKWEKEKTTNVPLDQPQEAPPNASPDPKS